MVFFSFLANKKTPEIQASYVTTWWRGKKYRQIMHVSIPYGICTQYIQIFRTYQRLLATLAEKQNMMRSVKYSVESIYSNWMTQCIIIHNNYIKIEVYHPFYQSCLLYYNLFLTVFQYCSITNCFNISRPYYTENHIWAFRSGDQNSRQRIIWYSVLYLHQTG